MDSVKVISTTTIQAPVHDNSTEIIELPPWDLQFLPLETIQKGLLFHQPTLNSNLIDHLKQTLSTTLSFFPPLTGRLIITHHNNDASCSLICNNVGVLFVHAKAENTTVSDILQPNYIPPIVHSFFPLNGVKNYEATSQPILAVQVTELSNGIFIAFTINHAVSDGKSFWHFVNSWSQISKGSQQITKLPSLQRWFPNDIELPIRFPFTITESQNKSDSKKLPERIFHFSKEKISELKSKANAEAEIQTKETKISSLQALLSHIWRRIVGCKQPDPQEVFRYLLIIGARPRMIPPLDDDYFGNAAVPATVVMKAEEILVGGIGKVGLEMNREIMLHSDEKIRKHYECWLRVPRLLENSLTSGNSLVTSSSPRFDVYGNDFGWGKPVAVRSGGANKNNGKITVFPGAEEGSIDIEVCLSFEILEALGNDTEFVVPNSK
ncbi:unnamed protein product [Lathyrus sativus]|nr:unnamed protein product [Lathyrus sativus]